jgi:hypothetical protein
LGETAEAKRSALPIVAVIIASVAALAGTVQGYVSWSNRSVQLRATILAQAVQKCASTMTLAWDLSTSAGVVLSRIKEKAVLTSATRVTLENYTALNTMSMELRLIISATHPDIGEAIFVAISDFAEGMQSHVKINIDAGDASLIDEKAAETIRDGASKLRKTIEEQCIKLVRSEIPQ